MTDLIVTVGLPCSGKSTWAKEFEKTEHEHGGWVIIESDQYRKELYGSEEIQGDNHKLFEKIHADIYESLSNEINVLFDATNLSYKHRKALLDKIKKLNVYKICILFATEYNLCLERNANRDRVVPPEVIKRMRENFTVPLYQEGWDEIQIVYEYRPEYYTLDWYLSFADTYDQKNYHHTMTLGSHSRKVAEYVSEGKVDNIIYISALLHDCGKPHTQVFHNMKGEPSEIAHYYGHENVGAYESLFFLNDDDLMFSQNDILFGSALINFHMRNYMAKTDKAKKKLEETIGSDLYYFLNILHDADVRAH